MQYFRRLFCPFTPLIDRGPGHVDSLWAPIEYAGVDLGDFIRDQDEDHLWGIHHGFQIKLCGSAQSFDINERDIPKTALVADDGVAQKRVHASNDGKPFDPLTIADRLAGILDD